MFCSQVDIRGEISGVGHKYYFVSRLRYFGQEEESRLGEFRLLKSHRSERPSRNRSIGLLDQDHNQAFAFVRQRQGLRLRLVCGLDQLSRIRL